MKLLSLFAISLLISCTCEHPPNNKDVTVDFSLTAEYAGQVTFTGTSGQGTFTFTAAEGTTVTKQLPDNGTYNICFGSTYEGITALEAAGVQYFSSKPCPQNVTLQSDYYLYPYPGD